MRFGWIGGMIYGMATVGIGIIGWSFQPFQVLFGFMLGIGTAVAVREIDKDSELPQ